MAESFRPLCLLLSVWIGSFDNAQNANRQRIDVDSCFSILAFESQSRQLVSRHFDKAEPRLDTPVDTGWLTEKPVFFPFVSHCIVETDWTHIWNRSWVGYSLAPPQKFEMAQSSSRPETDLTSIRINNDDLPLTSPRHRTNHSFAENQNRTGEIGNMTDAYWDYYESCDRWGAVFQKASWKRPLLDRVLYEQNPTGHSKRFAGRVIAVLAGNIDVQFKIVSAWTTALTRKLARSLDCASTSLERLYFLKLDTDCFVAACELEMFLACEACQGFYNCLPVFEKLAGENWAGQFAKGQNALFLAAKIRLEQFFDRSVPSRHLAVGLSYLPAQEWSWTWSTFENSLSNGIYLCRTVETLVNQLTKSLKSAALAFREDVLLRNQADLECCRHSSR